MKQITKSIIVICLFIPFLNCTQNKQQDKATSVAEYHKISAEEAKKMLDENSGIILLDVRSEEASMVGLMKQNQTNKILLFYGISRFLSSI